MKPWSIKKDVGKNNNQRNKNHHHRIVPIIKTHLRQQRPNQAAVPLRGICWEPSMMTTTTTTTKKFQTSKCCTIVGYLVGVPILFGSNKGGLLGSPRVTFPDPARSGTRDSDSGVTNSERPQSLIPTKPPATAVTFKGDGRSRLTTFSGSSRFKSA
jgi:hypothetical protein